MEVKCSGAAAAVLSFALVLPAWAQDTPKWLADAKARETRLGEPAELASEDGLLRTKVPGVVTHKVVLEDESYSINVDLDPKDENNQVSCEVMAGSRDLASFLSRIVDVSFERIQKASGTVEARTVEASDAGVIGPHPFMSLQWLYRVNHKGEKQVGALKQFAAIVDNTLVYCANNAIGYAKSFDTVTRALVAHLRMKGEATPQPYFKEVSVVTLDGARIGVGITTMTRDEDGDTKVLNKSAMLVQAAPGKLVSQDVVDVQWVRPDGSLINASQVKASNGELSEDMALQREDERWWARGTISGKPVDAELPGTPSSVVEQAKARRQLMAQAAPVGTHTEQMTWSSLDLTKLVASRATVLAPAGTDRFAAREELGGVALDVVLDKQTGTMASAKMPMGARTMNFERVYQHGSF